jgi:bacterioferritin
MEMASRSLPGAVVLASHGGGGVQPDKAVQERLGMDAPKSIALLNKAVADELQAVHQYMYWHFHLDDQGFAPLAGLLKRTAIVEMGHVEKLPERVSFLKGDVKMATSAPVEPITEPADILTRAAAMEQQSARDYNKAALECSANADAVS